MKSNIMNLNDIRKKYGLEGSLVKKRTLDDIRREYKLPTAAERAEEKSKLVQYGGYSEDSYRPYEQVKAELDAVTARRNTYDNEKAMRDSGISGKVWQKRYGEDNTARIGELEKLIADENKRIEKLTREATYSRMYGYGNLANNEDFDAKSVYDKNAKATVANQLYRQVNNPELPLTNEEYSDATREITRQMTADEVKIFNYIYNTQGDKAAQEYFDYLKTDAPDPLDARRGREIAGEIKTDVGRAIYGGIAAVDNTTQGVKQLFTSEAVKPTVAQYASAEAAEDIETKVGKFAYDLSATVGNMAPSILASTLVGVVNPLLGKAVGSTLMGAASAGNTYTDAINSGMTPRQAMKYGAMVGASEAALESVLGGISKLGANPIGKAAGKLVSGGKFAKAIGAVNNAFIRAAAKLAGSMTGEIAEEELQLFLEPLFKTMATDEKYDAPEWEEIAYTALISAASAGLFEAPGNIAEAVQESRQKKAEKILKDAIAEHEKQSEAQGETDAANADFANKVSAENAAQTAENAAQTANDTASAEMPSNRAVEAYTEMVNKYADTMDANGQNVFRQLYDGSVEPDVYTREMQSAYDAGRKGETLAAEDTAISQEQRQLAYNAGEADAYTEQHGYGLVRNDSSATLTGAENDKMLRNLDRLGKDLKVKIQFVDSLRGGTARGSYRNGVISIARGADNAYMTVAKHEISHHLEKTAPKAYAAYQTYALETVAKGWGMSVDALVQETISKAAQNGDKLTAAEAKAEIAADFTELIFANENTLRTFVEANSKTAEGRNLLQRLADAIRRFIASLKKTEVSVNTEAASKMGLGSVIDRLERAEKLFREVLTEGGKNRTGVSGDGKTQYVVKRDGKGREYWQIDSGKDIFKGLTKPEEYRDAAFAFLISNRDNKVVVKDKNGKEIIFIRLSAEEFTNNTESQDLFVNKPTMFTQKMRLIPSLEDILLHSNVNWRSPDHKNHKLFKKNGFENYRGRVRIDNVIFNTVVRVGKANFGDVFYDINLEVDSYLPHASNSASDINESTSTAIKIPQPDPSVKSQQSTKGGSLRDLAQTRDTDYADAVSRGDMETAQRMVDEAAKAAGYNYKLYHQTNADFNVFDVKHKGAGTTDDETPFGIFMKPTSSDIGLKGQKQMPLYAKIEKPLIANNRGSLMYELRKNKKVEDIQAEIARVNADYKQRVNQAGKDLQNYLIEYREKHPNEPRKNIYNDKMFNEIYEKEDSLIEEWGKKIDALSVVSKEHINDHLKREGYDGVIIENDAGSFGRSTKTYIALDNTQVKSADPVTYDDNGNVIPLSERFNPEQSDIRYSMGSGSLSELAKQYGEIAPGENPAREVHLPKKTEKNKNVSLTARTILEADTTPDIFVPTIEELVKDGTVSFETITDEYAYRVARDKVKNDHSATLEKWFKDVEAGKVSKDLTATGWALYAEAVAKPDKKAEAVDILLAMVGHQRNAAQALQATRILKKMSPEGMLVTAKRTATRLTEEANKRKEKAKDTRAIKQQAAQTDDAVRTARKDAARKTANKFTAAANSGKYEGTPFVFEYAQKVGEAVASSITREQADKEQTTMAIITSQLIRFAREKVPNAAKKSKNDILIDLVNNYDFYVKAYEFAQEEVARTHGEDERFTEFLDSPIGMDADSYAGKIIGKSIADAIIGVGETKKLIREKAALGFDEVFKAVGDYLVEKTGAKGRAENMLRSASAAYVSDIILTNPKTDAQIVDKLIREVIKDTGNKIRNTIAKGEDALNNLKSEVVNTLVNRYNLPSQYAAQAADIISTQFEQMAREEAAKELDRKFKEREIRTPKTQTEMLTELANLGAFKMDSPYNAQAVERLFRTGNVNITIDQVFAERLLAAKDEKAREDALHDIYRNIGRQMPSTFLDKWNAWRYLAMLGNPKTHIRNFSGNMFFAPAVMMKNITAAGIEKMVAGKNGRIDRTKALPSAELIKVGYNDYATLPDEIKAGEKYNDRAVANTYIQEGRQIFKNKYAEKARTFNSDLLSAEDDFFKRNHYAVALAMYCKANNIPASAFAATSGESRAIADNARRYAIKEAKKATFNDANAISNFMSRAGKSDSKAWNTFIDAVLPYRKTPANILVRGIEYSPVGLLKALSIDLVRVRRSDIPAAQMIDNIAAGMTGTGLMIAGIILSKLGVVFGGGGDKDEEEFEKLQGKQNYSLEAWGRSFTLDWLAPEALPFFVGVNLAEMTEIKDMSMKDALEAASNISAPLLEMSCLQSLNDMFESVSSAWGSGVSAIWQVPVNAATSYVTQALPTLFGQVERVFESKRETTYTDNNKWATSNMQYLAGKVFNKLPLESGQIPYIDAWGRETKEGNVVGRAAENLLSPAYVNKIYTSPMEKELQRLYEQTGEASVLPDRAGKKITVNGNEIDLTGKQYVQYATAKGQKSYEILTKMTDTAQYAKLTDADKVEVISKVYEYANALAKVETTKNLDKDKQYVPSSWVTKVQTTSEKMGIPEWKYLMIYAGTSGMSGYRYKTDPDKTIELSESLRKMEYIYSFIGLSDAQRQAIYSDLGIAKSVRNYTKDAVKQKLTQMRKIAK